VREQRIKMGVALPLLASRRWVAVVGAVGQPRDGNPAAGYAIWDEGTAELTFRRVPYDCGKTAMKVRAAGLPEALALRLLGGD
jgi:diadenosine tetraphosphatase ApaH/serine/threonine PP2A family protein phosphatase